MALLPAVDLRMLMGKANRPKPKYLAEKLLTIRYSIDGGLSQEEILRRLGLENGLKCATFQYINTVI